MSCIKDYPMQMPCYQLMMPRKFAQDGYMPCKKQKWNKKWRKWNARRGRNLRRLARLASQAWGPMEVRLQQTMADEGSSPKTQRGTGACVGTAMCWPVCHWGGWAPLIHCVGSQQCNGEAMANNFCNKVGADVAQATNRALWERGRSGHFLAHLPDLPLRRALQSWLRARLLPGSATDSWNDQKCTCGKFIRYSCIMWHIFLFLVTRWNLECLTTLRYNLVIIIVAAAIFHVNKNELARGPITFECMVLWNVLGAWGYEVSFVPVPSEIHFLKKVWESHDRNCIFILSWQVMWLSACVICRISWHVWMGRKAGAGVPWLAELVWVHGQRGWADYFDWVHWGIYSSPWQREGIRCVAIGDQGGFCQQPMAVHVSFHKILAAKGLCDMKLCLM